MMRPHVTTRRTLGLSGLFMDALTARRDAPPYASSRSAWVKARVCADTEKLVWSGKDRWYKGRKAEIARSREEVHSTE